MILEALNQAPLTLLLSQQLAFFAIQIYNRNMSEPFKLYRLQQIDSQLDQANKRLIEIEAALSDDKLVKKAKADKAATEVIAQQTQKELKRAEEEVQGQQIKIEQNQSRLYGGKVTNPKELQDLQNEAEAFKRNLGKLEDVQLEKMMNFEEADASENEAQDQVKSIQKQAAAQNSELTKEQDELVHEVERLSGERQAAITGIPVDDLSLYEKLRKNRAGVAVAKVSEKSCSACGSELPQALAQAVRSPSKISRCVTCTRILYSG